MRASIPSLLIFCCVTVKATFHEKTTTKHITRGDKTKRYFVSIERSTSMLLDDRNRQSYQNTHVSDELFDPDAPDAENRPINVTEYPGENNSNDGDLPLFEKSYELEMNDDGSVCLTKRTPEINMAPKTESSQSSQSNDHEPRIEVGLRSPDDDSSENSQHSDDGELEYLCPFHAWLQPYSGAMPSSEQSHNGLSHFIYFSNQDENFSSSRVFEVSTIVGNDSSDDTTQDTLEDIGRSEPVVAPSILDKSNPKIGVQSNVYSNSANEDSNSADESLSEAAHQTREYPMTDFLPSQYAFGSRESVEMAYSSSGYNFTPPPAELNYEQEPVTPRGTWLAAFCSTEIEEGDSSSSAYYRKIAQDVAARQKEIRSTLPTETSDYYYASPVGRSRSDEIRRIGEEVTRKLDNARNELWEARFRNQHEPENETNESENLARDEITIPTQHSECEVVNTSDRFRQRTPSPETERERTSSSETPVHRKDSAPVGKDMEKSRDAEAYIQPPLSDSEDEELVCAWEKDKNPLASVVNTPPVGPRPASVEELIGYTFDPAYFEYNTAGGFFNIMLRFQH